MKKEVYFCTQWMSDLEKEAVKSVMNTDWVTTVGPDQEAFEKEFSRYLHPQIHTVALNSGTAALELAYRLIGVGEGDYVICSTFTFIATISPAIRLGAIPIFIDSEEDSWNMDPSLLEDALKRLKKKGGRAKAVTLTHVYGQAADLSAIIKICQKYNVPLIEDAAEAVGTRYGKNHVGTQGDLSIFSFNGNKTITTGGGGALCSKNEDLLKKARHLAFQAKNPHSWDYIHDQLGYNYRLSNVLAAIGRAQIKRIPEILKKKNEIFNIYKKWAQSRKDVSLMLPPEKFRSDSSHWLNALRLHPTHCHIDREKLRDLLAKEMIQTRPVWYPLHRQPIFRGSLVYSRGVADAIHSESICLPSGLSLEKKDLKHILEALDKCLEIKPAKGRHTHQKESL